ncbi:MAG: nucleotide exchange factor GrpE [Firmicutes bacterium]|nr:nucleotide exchange factor GrpE [Bacillota bacterium]
MTEKDDILEDNVAETVEEETVVEEDSSPSTEQLEREKAQLAQQLLRLKADFENFRRRTKNQMESIQLDANEKLLKDLLPILDNFERALASQGDNNGEDPFFQGVEMVYQGLMGTLGNHGLTPILAVGQPFDPNLHEAVAMEGSGDDNLVVRAQVQTGYLLYDRVLRHTKVLVGQNEEEEECQK